MILLSLPHHMEVTATMRLYLTCYRGARIQTQVLMVVQEALWPTGPSFYLLALPFYSTYICNTSNVFPLLLGSYSYFKKKKKNTLTSLIIVLNHFRLFLNTVLCFNLSTHCFSKSKQSMCMLDIMQILTLSIKIYF